MFPRLLAMNSEEAKSDPLNVPAKPSPDVEIFATAALSMNK